MMLKLRRLTSVSIACLCLALVSAAYGQKPPIQITADLTEAPRRLFHAEIDLPVTAGPLILISSKWIPGNHEPTGPVSDITGIVFTANGKTLPWRRDDVDLYEFHVTIPEGVTTLHAHVDCIMASRVSAKLAALEWEELMLYPAHTPVRDISIQPSVKVPAGWGIGTALTPVSAGPYPVPAAGATTQFAATTVEQLQDSPIITGQYFHEYPLAPNVTPKHYLDVVADFPEDSNMRPEFVAETENLVREAGALYASHHYNVYHFLLTLSDVAGGEGLEHGQSSNNGENEKDYSDAYHQLTEARELPHEFTHSWDGKYRRPEGLYQPDFDTPMQGAMLWVYEGMTQYLGDLLATRAGYQTPANYLDLQAIHAAELDYTPARIWRSTEDTAISASILHGGGLWMNWRRGLDYYFEGELLWLDADTLIRQMTQNKKSLDDFVKIFLGKGGDTGPLIVPYSFDEVVKDLNAVVPYDWATFLRDRVDKINPHADVAGIERGGYKLAYKDTPSATERALADLGDPRGSSVSGWFSIGLRVGVNGTISDVRWNGPADKAKLAPREKIIAVNGRAYSLDVLRDSIRNAKTSAEPIHLIVQSDSFISTADIDYHDGEQFPVLERVEGTPDYMGDSIKAVTKVEKRSAEGQATSR